MAVALGGAGAPRRQFRLGQNSAINVTPFVDVMLVLLIIFMVIAPMATKTINLDLPPAAPGHGHPIVLSIADDGDIVLAGPRGPKATRLDELATDLAAAVGGARPADQQIYVRAEPHARYGRFMEVMNRLQADGYYKVGLVSETPRG